MRRGGQGPFASSSRRMKFNCVQICAFVEFPRRWVARDGNKERSESHLRRRTAVSCRGVSRRPKRPRSTSLFTFIWALRRTGHLFSQARNYIVSRSGLREPRARDGGWSGSLSYPVSGNKTPFRRGSNEQSPPLLSARFCTNSYVSRNGLRCREK